MSLRGDLFKGWTINFAIIIVVTPTLVLGILCVLSLQSEPEIEYIVDTRSDICYAYKNGDLTALTKVPCSSLIGMKVMVIK